MVVLNLRNYTRSLKGIWLESSEPLAYIVCEPVQNSNQWNLVRSQIMPFHEADADLGMRVSQMVPAYQLIRRAEMRDIPETTNTAVQIFLASPMSCCQNIIYCQNHY